MKIYKVSFVKFRLAFLFLLATFFTNTIHAQLPSCKTDEYLKSILESNSTLKAQFDKNQKDFYAKKNLAKTSSNQIITIPVVFNVLHSGESLGNGKNLSDAKILEQIQILNANYSNLYNKGVDMKIRFCLAQRDIHGVNRSGIIRYNWRPGVFSIQDDQIIKLNRDLAFPASHYLNVWTTDLVQGELGYSSFPFIVRTNNPLENEVVGNLLDGIVVDYKEVGIDPTDNQTGGGKTLVHEVGHWLGLYHTFHLKPGETNVCVESDCSTHGDDVCDTKIRWAEAWTGLKHPDTGEYLINPVTPGNCEKGEDICNFESDELSDAVQNYMDYNYDPCTRFFTQGQKDRVRQMIGLYRSALLINTNNVTECTTSTDDSDSGSTCSPVNEYTYKINPVYATNIAMNNGVIAIADAARGSVRIYEIVDECQVVNTSSVSKYGIADDLNIDDDLVDFGLNVKVQNNRIFVKAKIINDTAVIIYKKGATGWEREKTIKSDNSNFAKAMDAKDKELVITDLAYLSLYREVNGSYVLIQKVQLLSGSGFTKEQFPNTSLNSGAFTYNGKYVISRVGYKTYIFGKNSSGLFIKEKLGEIPYRYSVVTVDDNDNFYATINYSNQASEILVYSFGRSGLQLKHHKVLNNISNYLLREQQVKDIEVKNNIVFASRVGIGISLHSADNNLMDITVPNLQKYYPNNWIHPYKSFTRSDLHDLHQSDMGSSIVSDKNYLLVSNRQCSAVYIYKLNNLLDNASLGNAIPNVNLCNNPPNLTAVGNNVTIGGNCSVALGEGARDRIFIKALNEIRIKKGTRIVPGGSSRGAHTYLKINGLHPFTPDGCDFNETVISSTRQYSNGQVKGIDSSAHEIHANDKPTVAVVPNPVTSKFSLEAYNYNGTFSIEVYDILGRKVLVKSNMIKGDPINFGDQPNGLYMINVTKENGERSIIKFLKKIEN